MISEDQRVDRYLKKFPIGFLAGKKYGMLTVIGIDSIEKYNVTGHLNKHWLCICECGGERVVRESLLCAGLTRSCGCLEHPAGHKHPRSLGFQEISGSKWYTICENASRRNIEVEITIKEAWELFEKQGRKCAISGVPISFGKECRSHSSASFDRKDSNTHYTKENSQWVHWLINQAKNSMTDKDFVEMCHAVSEFHGNVREDTERSPWEFKVASSRPRVWQRIQRVGSRTVDPLLS